MENLDWKLKTPGGAVVDFRAIPCSAAKEGTLLGQHKWFVGCDVYYAVLAAGRTDFLLTFTIQMLESTSELSGSSKMKATAEVCRDGKAALLASRETPCEKFCRDRVLREICSAASRLSSDLCSKTTACANDARAVL